MGWLLTFALALLSAMAGAQTVSEQYLLSAINAERTRDHLPSLRLDLALTQAAQRHAEQMVRHGSISHQFTGEPELATRSAVAGARFDRIAENVAEGPSVIGLHDALMRSPGHRANILDSSTDIVGIAVIVHQGQLYAVEDFAHVVAPLTLDQQEKAVAVLLDQAGLEVLPGADARCTCALTSGYAGDERPGFVVRYTTANPDELPAALTDRLRSGREHRAAVGACPARATPFSQFNFAVMLFR